MSLIACAAMGKCFQGAVCKQLCTVQKSLVCRHSEHFGVFPVKCQRLSLYYAKTRVLPRQQRVLGKMTGVVFLANNSKVLLCKVAQGGSPLPGRYGDAHSLPERQQRAQVTNKVVAQFFFLQGKVDIGGKVFRPVACVKAHAVNFYGEQPLRTCL